VCNEETNTAFEEYAAEVREASNRLFDMNYDDFVKFVRKRVRKFLHLKTAIRKELGIDTTATPQSTGSSASPTPD
jgi:hypothetical protein